MSEQEEKTKKEKLINESMITIKKFISKNLSITPSTFENSNLIKNLKSLITLIKTNNFSKEKIEQLSILSIKKVSNELLSMLSCKSLPNKILFDLTHTVHQILLYSNNELINNLLIGDEKIKYAKIFYKLLKISICEMYYTVKKGRLINGKFFVFLLIHYLNFVFPNEIKNMIYYAMSRNVSLIYILITIIIKQNLIINESKELFYEFLVKLSNIIISQRNLIKSKTKYNKTISKFLEELLIAYINNYYTVSNKFTINLFSLCFFYKNLPLIFL